MATLQILNEIFTICIIPLLGILTKYLIDYISVKSEQIKFNKENALTEKYKKELTKTIIDCVKATNQTYVDSLKNQNAFDKEAQKKAFEKTSEAVMKILSEDAVMYLNQVYGDLNVYIITQIEATVESEKTNKGTS